MADALKVKYALSGSKNATLAIFAATLLPSTGQTVLRNVPQISDVMTMLEMLRHLGVKADWTDPATVMLDATALTSYEAPYELIKKMRASFSVLGPLVARFGKARVALPGGCDIGARPVDYHLKGLERLGATSTRGARLCSGDRAAWPARGDDLPGFPAVSARRPT